MEMKKTKSKKSRDTIPLNAYPDTVRPIELRGAISNDDEVVVSSTKPKFKTGIQASMNCFSNNWERCPLSSSGFVVLLQNVPKQEFSAKFSVS